MTIYTLGKGKAHKISNVNHANCTVYLLPLSLTTCLSFYNCSFLFVNCRTNYSHKHTVQLQMTCCLCLCACVCQYYKICVRVQAFYTSKCSLYFTFTSVLDFHVEIIFKVNLKVLCAFMLTTIFFSCKFRHFVSTSAHINSMCAHATNTTNGKIIEILRISCTKD